MRTKNITLVVGVLLSIVLLSANAQAQMSITSLVDLGGSTSFALGISSDGSTVVGVSGGIAYKWQTLNGMGTRIGTLGGTFGGTNISNALAVSSDGSFIAGRSTAPVSVGSTRAFLWNSGAGMTDLGLLPRSNNSHGTGISANGNVVAGYVEATRLQAGTLYNTHVLFTGLQELAW
jgi:probable HAF family extracellular repeat protein